MTVLFGHPTGNPNAHHAALAHFEAGRLEACCVPWMPRDWELRLARLLPGLAAEAARLSRRRFAPLAAAPLIEGRWQEWRRMGRRLLCATDERVSYEANDWLMNTMRRACARPAVTAIHAYEDCALGAFEEARRRGKACIYDMPIGYYPAWERRREALMRRYGDWVNAETPGGRYVRRDQKCREMELADLVLVPSSFVASTVETYMDKRVARCAYGVDPEFWQPGDARQPGDTLRFVYAGACSLRKGTPVLLQAWEAAQLKDARLDLVGSWQLDPARRANLPAGVRLFDAASAPALRGHYQAADVFVFPSCFEGYGLVILEALACGLPVIATDATAGPDVLDEHSGRVLPAGDVDALVDALRWFDGHRAMLPQMQRAARERALHHGWERYRRSVSAAVEPYVG